MFPEIFQILCRFERAVEAVTGGTAHSEDLPGQDPVHVALVHVAEVVIAVDIEGPKVVELELLRLLNGAKAILERQIEVNLPDATITICDQLFLDFMELFLNGLGRLP